MVEYEKKIVPRRMQRHHKEAAGQLRYIQEQQHNLNVLTEQVKAVANDPVMGKVLHDIEITYNEIRRLEFVERYLEASIQIEQARGLLSTAFERGELEAGLAGFEALAKVDSRLDSIKARAKEIGDAFRAKYEERLRAQLKDALEACKWPSPIDPAEWDSPAVTQLATAAHDWARFHLGDMRPVLRLLLEPIRVRFGFHFESDRPTNRADKPEWLFAHLLKTASEHAQFFASYLQPMIGGDSNLLDLFLSELVALARNRLGTLKPVVSPDGLMLAHTIEEAAKFHGRLWEEYGYEDGQSCVAVFTKDEECLSAWIANEKAALDAAFKAIADAHPEWTPDPSTGVDPFIYEAIALFNSVTVLYEGIEDNRVRVKFLVTLQIPLLEALYTSMEFGLPAFHSTPEDLQRTLAIANTAQILLRVIREDWAQSLLFIELGCSKEFAEYSSASGVFAKSIQAFGEALLQGAVLGNIQAFIWDQFTGHANNYARAMHYGLTVDEDESILPHPELEKSLIALNSAIDFLRQHHLDNALLCQVQSRLVPALGEFFFTKVVLRNYFHQEGTIAFRTDLETTILRLEAIFAASAPPQDIRKAFAKTADALKILELPGPQAVELADALRRNDFARVSAVLKALPVAHLSMPECAEVLKAKKM